MNADEVTVLAKASLDGSMPFPEIVGKLIANSVETYHVDFAARSFTFYGASGSVVVAPIAFENLPRISDDFDATALKAAILDSQQLGQKFRAFCGRAMLAGVQGYFAYLRGKRVTYFGRCFQLMECDDIRLIQKWVLEWRGFGVSFEVVPVVSSKDTREVVDPYLGKN